ncbi:MAG: VacB/RNase II family 3'-5' exoribonuclease [Proteobacteria bacterium]|nr:VacB/RNase II family 3'-5' exoribonuclease [Pseudomonadota bacterium]
MLPQKTPLSPSPVSRAEAVCQKTVAAPGRKRSLAHHRRGGKSRERIAHPPLQPQNGADARDFDDAVHAEKDSDPANPGGWKLIVAIADVAHYVHASAPLDREAYKRGNSVYFPDRVVPMLPEALSNELCSLKPHVDRACLAAHLVVDDKGELLRFHFTRALMRSAARLTYEQIQKAADGAPDETTTPLMDKVVTPLYQAYAVLLGARKKRGTLDLEVQENYIRIGADGKVAHIGPRERLDAHKLIEEFMILANVAAASALQEKGMAGLYRVHDVPSPEKLESLRAFLKGFDINLPVGKQLRSIDLARVLEKFIGSDHAPLINEVMLRNQAQAIYSADNIGHFGLALARYAHFTSPIRRYADLVVHRALIRLYKLGEDGLSDPERAKLNETGEHISKTERRAIEAERESNDRYTSLYLSGQVGGIFEARISGVTRSGLFVRLKETGADGLLPMSSLPSDYYMHDEKHHRLTGKSSGRVFQLAGKLRVRLVEADGVRGSLRFMLAEDKREDGAPQRKLSKPGGRQHQHRRRRPHGRKKH